MKTGNSNNYPKVIEVSNGFFQCLYNIKESIRKSIDGKECTTYDYDYIEVQNLTENEITGGLLKNGYQGDSADVVSQILEYQKKNEILGNINDEMTRIINAYATME